MKIWFNKVHEAKRVLIESDSSEIRIGRDPTNIIVRQSPLVSMRASSPRLRRLRTSSLRRTMPSTFSGCVSGCLTRGSRL
ncbi:MAG: hypothetical protein AABP62_13870 [Planctomycetota bacterium]